MHYTQMIQKLAAEAVQPNKPIGNASTPSAIKRIPRGQLKVPMNPMQLLHGIAYAEHSVPDEASYYKDKYWTRTSVRPTRDPNTGKWVGSSTAFGPNQLTDGKFNSYITREYKEAMRPYRSFYYNTMEPIYKNFRRYGMEPNKPGYDKRWDYGGYGRRLSQKEKETYKRVVAEMLRLDYNKVLRDTRNMPLSNQGRLDRVIQRWRGKSITADPKYYKRVNQFLRKNYPVFYED